MAQSDFWGLTHGGKGVFRAGKYDILRFIVDCTQILV
jgi:hypothetical protein